MKSVESILTRWREKLKPIYDPAEAEQIIFLVMEEVMKFSRIDLSIRKSELVKDSMQICLEAILRKLEEGMPVQYVLGFAWFDGLKIDVNRDVLIPRQETEELVSWIVSEIGSGQKVQSVLDICSGSGCIALAIKNHFPEMEVSAIDISQEAIDCAKRNSEKLNLALNFFRQDVLSLKSLPIVADIIVSNPPYVKQSESNLMHDKVLRFEPYLALFVPDSDALIFYEKIAYLAMNNLSKNGQLFFEINESLGEEVGALLSIAGFRDIKLRKDLNAKFRMIRAVK